MSLYLYCVRVTRSLLRYLLHILVEQLPHPETQAEVCRMIRDVIAHVVTM